MLVMGVSCLHMGVAADVALIRYLLSQTCGGASDAGSTIGVS